MNVYTDLSTRLVSTLQTELATLGYAPLDVRKGIWKPRQLAPFDRYLVFVAPPLTEPWREIRDSARNIIYVLRAELFLLVKNYDEDQSVYGDTAPNFGVWQLVSDVKAVLRATDLNGLVDRTYRETEGGSAFESGATGGFDTGEHGWVHRAKLVYNANMHPFCYP